MTRCLETPNHVEKLHQVMLANICLVEGNVAGVQVRIAHLSLGLEFNGIHKCDIVMVILALAKEQATFPPFFLPPQLSSFQANIKPLILEPTDKDCSVSPPPTLLCRLL